MLETKENGVNDNDKFFWILYILCVRATNKSF